MPIDIRRVTDLETARQWHAVQEVAQPYDLPGTLADPLEEVLARLPEGLPSTRIELYVASERGITVGATALKLPMLENTDVAQLEITVLPDARRQGIGRSLFSAMADRARAGGRQRVDGTVSEHDGVVSPGKMFAEALGASEALGGLRYGLTLGRVDHAGLQALAGESAAQSPGYELAFWVDRAPDEFVDDWAALESRMATDTPQGDLGLEPDAWDARRCRESEEQTIARGRARLVTVAREANGRLVGTTDLTVSRSRPVIAYQWDTIVAPEHRGHRLGTRMKVANLLRLIEEFPSTDRIYTWNALENSYMRAVNEALGFEPVARFSDWKLAI